MVHISLLDQCTDTELLSFYDTLTAGLGQCHHKTEDGRTNEIVDGKWLKTSFKRDRVAEFLSKIICGNQNISVVSILLIVILTDDAYRWKVDVKKYF